jgi:hypothetical protein
MKKSVDLIKLISILLLLVVFVSEYYSNMPAISSFVLVFGLLSTRYELQDAIIIAIIFSSIVVMLFSYFYQNVEGFADGKEEKGKNKEEDKEGKEGDKEDDKEDKEDDKEEKGDKEENEKSKNVTGKKKKKKKRKKSADEETGGETDEETDEETGGETDEETGEETDEETGEDKGKEIEKEDYVDIGTSFLEAYKNLSPNQIKSMTKDTKQLLNVQKNLMKTIEGLTPIVKEGKSVLDTFRGYFDELK